MKFMHIADVHLGVVPDKGKSWSESRAHEVQETFSRVLRVVADEKVDLLLIAGDLYHFPPTISMLKELDSMLLENEGMTTVIIAGNHDYMTENSPYARYEFQSDTVVLRTEEAEQLVFDDLKVCVTGRSYDRQQITEALYDDLTPQLAWELTEAIDDADYPEALKDYFQILIAHGGDSEHCPMDYNKLKKSGFDYIALGHIHKPAAVVQDKIIYVGSLEPIDVTDTGERGYVIGEIIGEHIARIQWIPFSTRQYIDSRVDVQADWTNYQLRNVIAEGIESYGINHIYRIILEGNRAVDMQPDLSSLEQKYCISMIEDHTREAIDYERLERENADNILGRFIRSMRRENPTEVELKALEYGVKALLNNQG